MKKIQTLSVSLALLLGAGTLAFGQASAAPVSGKMGTRVELASQVELVGKRDGKHWWYKHGRRHRDHDHRHFHGGLWFAVPFWLGAAALTAHAYDDDDDSDAHIAYCMDRYRSYHPPSNTFLGYDGERHECVSPYE
jgi:hypothetical protein